MPRIPSFLIILLLSVLTLPFLSCASGEAGSADDSGKVSRGDDRKVERPEEGEAENEDSAGAVLDEVYTDTADAGNALEALERAGVESMDDDSRLVYAVLLRNEGRLDESRAELEALLSNDGTHTLAWFNLALLEHAAGNEDARDKALDEAIASDNTFAEAHAFRGNLAIADSSWHNAESSLRRALDLESDSVESMVGLAWVYAKTNRIKEALPLLDRAVELEPDFAYARVDRSRVNVALRNYNAAEDDLDVVIELEPDIPWHYLDRARIRLRYFKEYEDAQADLEKVEELDPGNFFALVYLAGLHDEERRFAISRDYYQQVVEARPDYAWAFMPLGKFAWMAGDYAEAAKWYGKAVAEDSEEFSFLLMEGLSLIRTGKAEEGNRAISDALRLYRNGDAAYEVIRFCLERSSDFYAVNALNKEENDTLRERLWFYLGAIYEMEDNAIGSQSVYERLEKQMGAAEYDMAYAALNGMDG